MHLGKRYVHSCKGKSQVKGTIFLFAVAAAAAAWRFGFQFRDLLLGFGIISALIWVLRVIGVWAWPNGCL